MADYGHFNVMMSISSNVMQESGNINILHIIICPIHVLHDITYMYIYKYYMMDHKYIQVLNSSDGQHCDITYIQVLYDRPDCVIRVRCTSISSHPILPTP